MTTRTVQDQLILFYWATLQFRMGPFSIFALFQIFGGPHISSWNIAIAPFCVEKRVPRKKSWKKQKRTWVWESVQVRVIWAREKERSARERERECERVAVPIFITAMNHQGFERVQLGKTFEITLFSHQPVFIPNIVLPILNFHAL